ncbi:GGDEF domain-containing protein [Gordonia malaquae]|uniref:GGDEF domain-containing protein n=1 Tax=Gordonia malaquae TaxID=410332 RepID=UPI0012F724F3|nr:GGDEF domain-containing protein [Gordonia malaquae]
MNPRSDEFMSAYVDAGRWYKAEIAIIMFGAVGGLYVFERLLFEDPAPMVNSWPSVMIGFGLANALRLASCFRWAVPTWSTALFITSVYIDVVWLMVIRAVAVNDGHDVLPIIVPVAFLASLLIVHIRYVILVPAMLAGFAMIAGIELFAVPSSGPGLFDLMTSGAIIVVPLISARFHEQQTRLTWERERRLDELSMTDALTGLANRRAFDARIAAALAEDSPVALAVLDVDDFKVLNDALGHAAGDDTLRTIGRFLTGSITDERVFAARLSGEEFAVVWSGSGRSGVIEDAERLRSGIGALELPSGRADAGVTMSAGVVWFAPPTSDEPGRSPSPTATGGDRTSFESRLGSTR